MKIKVCGMKHPQNINDLTALNPDFIGFIFYEKSPRFVETLHATSLPENIKKVGVFVNETAEKILETVQQYGLDVVQLHGAETPDFCKNLKQKLQDVKITKAINIENVLDIEKTKMYDNDCCDYFLFDTKTHLHGGSGQKFEWWMLDWYDSEIPFFLSGGISTGDVEKIKEIHHDLLYGIDINSKFEIEPGLKDIEKVKTFITHIRK
jgi:phosphoribosylanthranilate isomerase